MRQRKMTLTILLLATLSPLFAAPVYKFKINGIKKELLANAKERIKVIIETAPPKDKRSMHATYRAGFKEIKTALQPFGYFKAKVTGNLQYNGNNAVANYYVNTGPAIRITRLNFDISGSGAKNSLLIKAKNRFRLRAGQVLSVIKYQKAKSILLNQAKRQGYIFAKLETDQVNIDLITYQVTMNLDLNTGPRFYFGKTTMNKTPLKESFLRRFLNYKRGKHYNPNKLTNLQDLYGDTGYFKSVTITPKIPDDNPKNQKTNVPVDINFLMAPKHLYQIGLGYGTVTGIRVLGAVNWRWLNSSGHKFNLSGLWSRKYYQLTSQYLIPSNTPKTAYYTINGTIFIMTPQSTKASVGKFGPGYLWQKGKWTFDAILYFLYEKWSLNKNELPFTYSHLIMPQFSITRLSQKNVIKVENGSRFKVTFSGAAKPAYSSLSYFQTEVEAKWIKTIAKNNRFILMTIDGITTGSELDKLPLSERFFAGGPNSLLGFGYQGIGPGRYLTVANAAYQRRIYGSIYAEVFYNIGNAFDSFNDYSHNLRRSAGLAAVWRTPVGDLTVYWAKVLSQPNHPNRFGFSLGPEL